MDIFNTDRLILRQINDEFTEEVLCYYQRNRNFLSEWEAQRSEAFFTLEYQRNLLQKDWHSYENGQSYKLWIFKKDNPEKIIGCISFNHIIRGILQSCILGYKLDEKEANMGYIKEGLRKAIEIAFEKLKLHRIEAPIMPKNLASMEAVKKLDFINEGLSPKMIKVNGVWEDHVRWALLNEEE